MLQVCQSAAEAGIAYLGSSLRCMPHSTVPDSPNTAVITSRKLFEISNSMTVHFVQHDYNSQQGPNAEIVPPKEQE